MAGGRTSVMCARGADSARLPSRLTIPASRSLDGDDRLPRVEPERLLEMLPGLPRAAHVHQDARQVVVGIGVVGLQSQRLLQVLDGVLWATELEKHGAKIVVGIRVVRLQLESALVVFG